MSSKKDAEQLVRDLRRYFSEAGLDYTLVTRKGKWHVLNADGKSLASFASTPSNNRFRRNEVTWLRQRGIVPDDWR